MAKAVALIILASFVLAGAAIWVIRELFRSIQNRPKIVYRAVDPDSPITRDFEERYEQLTYLLLKIWASDVTRAQLGSQLAAKLGAYFGTRKSPPSAPPELHALIDTVTRLEDWLQEVKDIRVVHEAMPMVISTQVDAYLAARQRRIGN